jgi:hypothetical protein
MILAIGCDIAVATVLRMHSEAAVCKSIPVVFLSQCVCESVHALAHSDNNALTVHCVIPVLLIHLLE